jgi:gliding motility-associated-like protein
MGKIWNRIVALLAIMVCVHVGAAAQDASNIDFSNRFEGWTREIVYFKHVPKVDPTDPNENDSYAFRYETMADDDDRITIMGTTATYDEVVACSDMLPINPDPGKVVARIGVPRKTEAYVAGSSCSARPDEAQGERLSYTYKVDEKSNILYMRYATVLFLPPDADPTNPSHRGEERPTFRINVNIVDPNTGLSYTPPCKTFQTITDETSSVLVSLKDKPICASTKTDNYHNYQYLPWTTAVVDLRGHEGRMVTLSVEVHDCLVRCTSDVIKPGGHEAYGYFRAEATSYQLKAMACNGNDLELIAPEGYAKYEWRASLGDAPVIRNENEPNKAYLDPTRMQIGATYYCDMYDQMHCSKITIEAQVDPVQLTPNYSYENFCNGKVQFTDISTAVGDEIVGWLWDFGDGAKSNLQHPQHEYSEPKEYTVTLTVTSSKGCSETLQGTVNVRYFPKLNIQSEPFVCAGQDIHLSVLNVVEEGSDIVWTDANGVELGYESSLVIRATNNPAQSNTYYVQVTDLNGCVYKDDRSVSVFKAADIYIDGPAQVCPGDEVNLEVKGSDVVKIKWNTPEQHQASQITVYPSQYTLYKVEAEDNKGCSAYAEFAVNVHELPTVQIDAPVAVCKGDEATMRLSGANGYLWQDLPASATSNNTLAVQTVALSDPTTFHVTAFSEEGCKAYTSFFVDVLEHPVVSIEPVEPYCYGGAPVQVTAHGADTYTWNQTITGNSITIPTDREVHLSLVGVVGACKSEPLLIDLSPLDRPVITVDDKHYTICDGDELELSATGASQYEWLPAKQLSDVFHVSPSQSTTYYVSGISDNGCHSDTIAIEVEVKSANQVSVQLDKLIVCPNQLDSVILSASGALTYEWYSEPSLPYLASAQSDRISFSYPTDMRVYVKGINEYACGSVSYVDLTVQPEPEFKFSLEPNWIEEKQSTVHVTGVLPYEEAQWRWNMGDGSGWMSARDTVYEYTINQFSEPFLVKVMAIDANGCVFEGESEIKIWKEMWAPTAFTPNGDGLNDTFHFYGVQNISSLDFYIYNRLGEVVYEGKSTDDAWDGTYQGQPCPWGVYGWVAHYTATVNDAVRDVTLKGQVSIVK